MALTVNHEGLADRAAIDAACAVLAERTGLPVCDPLIHGVGPVIDALAPFMGA